MREYTLKFTNLCLAIGTVSEDEKIDKFVSGLKIAIQKEVWLKTHKAIAEAMLYAQQLDDMGQVTDASGGSGARGAVPKDLDTMHDERERR